MEKSDILENVEQQVRKYFTDYFKYSSEEDLRNMGEIDSFEDLIIHLLNQCKNWGDEIYELRKLKKQMEEDVRSTYIKMEERLKDDVIKYLTIKSACKLLQEMKLSDIASYFEEGN